MAGAMIDRVNVARQLMADGLVQEANNPFLNKIIEMSQQLEENEQKKAADMEIAAVPDGKEKKTRRPFDPADHGIDSTFRLSRYADMRGRKCKIPTAVIQGLLQGVQNKDTAAVEEGVPRVGLSMDCSISPVRMGGLSVIQTSDILYPVVDDPVIQGKIAGASVLSALYAIGVTSVDNMLCLLSISTRITETERDKIVPLLLEGFKEAATEAGTSISGGQTVMNPWLSMGGVATSICKADEYIVPDAAIMGDVLVLTKPLGTQVAINSHEWLADPLKWSRISSVINEEEIEKAYNKALDSMIRSNRTAAILMHKYNAHGATDISKFGLLGHAATLARCQVNEVSFVIHNLPVIAKMAQVAKTCEITKGCEVSYGLMQGQSSEISGGLLICLPREQAAAYCKDMERLEGTQSWIIGIVEKGDRSARIIDKPRVIEVCNKDVTEKEAESVAEVEPETEAEVEAEAEIEAEIEAEPEAET